MESKDMNLVAYRFYSSPDQIKGEAIPSPLILFLLDKRMQIMRGTKKRTVLLLLLAILGVISIIVLKISTDFANSHKNGFSRKFIPAAIIPVKGIDLVYHHYYIAGLDSDSLYIGNFRATAQLLVTDYRFSDTQYREINIDDTGKIAWAAIKIHEDFPNLYIGEDITPALIRQDMQNYKSYRYHLDSNFFISFLPLSISSILFTTYNSAAQHSYLKKEIPTSKGINSKIIPLQKQVDGFFSSDGIILYNKMHQRVIYVYKYRNLFHCLDTNLNILYNGHTIDTTQQVLIKVGEIKSENKLTMTTPRYFVNRLAATDGDYIYINSALMANNEQTSIFRQNSVIDVYSLKTGEYQYSFYLPHIKKQQLRDFKIRNGNLFAVYDTYLYHFKLNINQPDGKDRELQ